MARIFYKISGDFLSNVTFSFTNNVRSPPTNTYLGEPNDKYDLPPSDLDLIGGIHFCCPKLPYLTSLRLVDRHKNLIKEIKGTGKTKQIKQIDLQEGEHIVSAAVETHSK